MLLWILLAFVVLVVAVLVVLVMGLRSVERAYPGTLRRLTESLKRYAERKRDENNKKVHDAVEALSKGNNYAN